MKFGTLPFETDNRVQWNWTHGVPASLVLANLEHIQDLRSQHILGSCERPDEAECFLFILPTFAIANDRAATSALPLEM